MGTCRGLYGESSLKQVGLSGPLPRRPWLLAKKGKLAQDVLRTPESELEPTIETPDGEATITPEQLANRLEPELGELRRLVEGQKAEIREASDMRGQRRQEIDDFDREVGGIARMMQGMLWTTGRKDLASVFRFALKRFYRRRRKQQQQGEEPVVVIKPIT